MSELKDFSIKCQLDDIQEIDRYFTCVPTSIASALQYLTGKAFDGADIKDQVYSPGYQGPTDPAQYVAYCQRYGVHMYSINGSNTQLISIIQQQLALNHPVLLQELDPYVRASLGFTHAVIAFKCDSESVTVADPYIGQAVTKSNTQWEQDLRYNQVWVLEKVEVLSIDQAKDYFIETQPDQTWKCKQTGFTVSHGILAYYRSCTNSGLNGISQYGLPLGNEESIPNATGCVLQRFERGVLIWDDTHKLDRVPGISGPCYPAHIDKGPGRDPAIVPLLNENSQLLNEVDQLKKQLVIAKIPPTISTDKQ